MTEADWLTCQDPRLMSDVVQQCPRASDRTCRLFVAAFWAWLAEQLPDSQRVVYLRNVAATEHWAETGRLPHGTRVSSSEDTIFFNANAKRALHFTIRQSYAWGKAVLETVAVQPPMLREIFGNPFRPDAFDPTWRTETAVSLAKQMYEAREFGAMPILADALQDAGCDNEDVLKHCRDTMVTHVRGCWLLDAVLGRG
jgi:hypothetical protein